MSLSDITLAFILRNILPNHYQVILNTNIHNLLECWVPGPFLESCTVCTVGNERGKTTSTMTSDSGVAHPVNRTSGPSGCPRYRETPIS
jgi:hypothetical protein